MIKHLKIILPFIFMFLSFGFLLPKTYALTSETIYADYNNGTLTNSGKFKYSPSNLGLLFDSATGSLGTKYETASYGLRFWFSEAITTSNTYTIQLNFNDYDVYESLSINYVKVYIYSNDDINEASLLSVSKSNKSTQYKTLTIKFVSNYTGTIVRVDIQKENNDSTYAKIFGPLNFRLNSVQTETSQAEGTEQIIINNNQNTQNIINNENQNTQNIIDNQNQNTQDMIDSQKSCNTYDKSNVSDSGKYLGSTGGIGSNSSYGITDYININDGTLEITDTNSTSWVYACYYKKDKTVISCSAVSTLNGEQTIPSNAYYFRTTIYLNGNTPKFKVCKNGNQAITDSITDDSVENSDYSDFFSNFSTNTFGLTSIVTAPLNLIESLTSTTCQDLQLPLPYLNNKKITLPCMSSIYSNYFGNFFTIYQTITFGIVAYWVIVRIFNQVKDFKNPDHDEIEVVDL